MLFAGTLSLQRQPWLADHALGGVVLLPGTAFVEMALAAGAHLGCGAVEELTIAEPLVLPEDGAVRLQCTVGRADDSGARPFRCTPLWRKARLDLACHRPAARRAGRALARVRSLAAGRRGTARRGRDVRPAGRARSRVRASVPGLRAAWLAGEEVFAEIEVDAADSLPEVGLHPALFDAALHAIGLRAGAGSA